MDRRSFLKLGGVAAAAGLTGSCGQAAQKIIPYVVPPDDGVNPVEGWFFATTCRICNAGCGVMVRTVEGRAKKIEGNPDHPINRGGVCARGQASVSQLYHPERLTGPLKRKGDSKGKNSFEKISWDEALSILTDKISQSKGKGAFVMASDTTDVTSAIANRLLGKLGSNDFVAPTIGGEETYRAASSTLHEAPQLPYHDIAQSSFVLLLGADIFENSPSPVHYGWAFGEMRRGDPTRRGVLMYAGPRVSMTAATADRFIATRPGTLGVLALGIAHQVLNKTEEEKLLSAIPRPTVERWFTALKDYTLRNTYKITGAPGRVIEELAEEFMTHQPGIAVAGDDVSAHSNGVDSLKAVEFLNMILREISRAKGNLKIPLLPYKNEKLFNRMKSFLGGPGEEAKDFTKLQAVAQKAKEGKIELGIVINTNPSHSTPSFLKIDDALKKVGYLVCFDTFLNDTTRYADLVLPDHHFLESWSAQTPSFPYGVPIFNAQQPVVRPLYDTKPAGEVLLKAAKSAGLDLGFISQEEMILKMISEFRAEWRDVPPMLSDRQAWEYILQKGGYWADRVADDVEPPPGTDRLWEALANVKVELPVFDGDKENTFFLHPYETVPIGDGRVANLGWLQETPEPVTTLSWGSWVEINPTRAAELGIKNGDILKISSSAGEIEAPAILYPGIGPTAVALPFGYGHTDFGKLASGRGANAMTLIGDNKVSQTGAPAWRGIKVTIAKTGRSAKMVREGHQKGEYEGEVFQL